MADWVESPLHSAVRREKIEELSQLINEGIDVNAKDSEGYPALDTAVTRNVSINIFKKLLDAGADPNLKNRHGLSPLHLFVGNSPPHDMSAKSWENEYQILKMMLKAGGNANMYSDADKYTALQYFFHLRVHLIIPKCMGKVSLEKSLKLLLECSDINLTYYQSNINILAKFLESGTSSEKRKFFYKIILKHVAKVKALDLPVDSSLHNVISRTSDLNNYFTACTQELEKAKSTKLNNSWVTFVHILVADKYKLTKFAGNRDLNTNFKKNVHTFTIYGERMRKNKSKGIEIRKLYDEAAEIISHYCPIFNPTHLIIKDTLETLKKEDWKMLCE